MATETVTAPAAGGIEKETVNRREFAKLLGISAPTLDRHRDRLPAPLKLGGRIVLWSRAEALAFVRGERR